MENTLKQLEEEINKKESFITAGGYYDKENRLKEEEKECIKEINELIAKHNQTQEIIKMIERRIKYCKSELKKDFEKDKIWEWRIDGFKEIISRLKGNNKQS